MPPDTFRASIYPFAMVRNLIRGNGFRSRHIAKAHLLSWKQDWQFSSARLKPIRRGRLARKLDASISYAVQRLALAIGVAGTIFALAACIEPSPELIVTSIPGRLRVGESGVLQVSIVSQVAIANAVLSVSASPGLEVSPDRVTLSRIPAVGGAKATEGSSPHNPPALGVVPIRNFHLLPKEVGEQSIKISLVYDKRSVTKLITVPVVTN